MSRKFKWSEITGYSGEILFLYVAIFCCVAAMGRWIIGGAIVLMIPFVNYFWIQPFLHKRQMKKTRESLSKCGLIPEKYVATLPAHEIDDAKKKFGL